MARNFTRSSSGSALVLGQLQHALVELEPGQLAVGVELGRVELGCRWRCGNSFHSVSLYGGASR